MAQKQIKVKSYTRKDGTKVKGSERTITAAQKRQNLRNAAELARRRTGKELLQDVGAALTSTIIPSRRPGSSGVYTAIPYSEISNKRNAAIKASMLQRRLDRVKPRELTEVMQNATDNFRLDPNSKTALRNINKLENRAKLAGMKPKRYKKLVNRHKTLMERAGFTGMTYRGTDFNKNSSTLEFTKRRFERAKFKQVK